MNTIFVWLCYFFGVAMHAWYQAYRSSQNSYTPWKTVSDYLNRYTPLIIIRVLCGIVIYGVWWRNPEAVPQITAAMAAKVQGIGWGNAAVIFAYVKISPHDIFTALGFGLSLDGVLYFLAKYVPGFKSIVPDLPPNISIVDAGKVIDEQAKKTSAGE